MSVADRNNDVFTDPKNQEDQWYKTGQNKEINPFQGIAWSDKDEQAEEQK